MHFYIGQAPFIYQTTILQCADKRRYLLIFQVSSYRCLSVRWDDNAGCFFCAVRHYIVIGLVLLAALAGLLSGCCYVILPITAVMQMIAGDSRPLKYTFPLMSLLDLRPGVPRRAHDAVTTVNRRHGRRFTVVTASYARRGNVLWGACFYK